MGRPIARWNALGRTVGIVAFAGAVTHGGTREPLPLPCVGEADGPPSARQAPLDSALALRLNLPAYRLEVRERGVLTRTIRVAVGQPRYPTPRGTFVVDYVVWNPWWRPPDAAWARRERPAPPGWSNPVGRVKLHVVGLVFMHGTPAEASLGTAASHACIRLANRDAMALARLVHAYGSPAVRPGTLDSLEADTLATRQIPLQQAIPITIRYDLVEVVGDDLVLYPDIYRLAGRSVPSLTASARDALARVGRDTSRIRLPALRQLVQRIHDQPVIVALDSLAPLVLAR